MCGPPFDREHYLPDDLRRVAVPGIKETGERQQFRLGDGGVPQIGCSQRNFRDARKTALQFVDVDHGVEKQSRQWSMQLINEGELGPIARFELSQPLLRLEPPQRPIDV